MIGFIIGVILTAIFYTFLPGAGVRVNTWIRKQWVKWQTRKDEK